ncbi:uncharacterized protein LOC135845844 isoform X2 [Planococcus citri]
MDAANLRVVIRCAKDAHVKLENAYAEERVKLENAYAEERVKLENAYAEERRRRLVYQSFIDISASTKKLFQSCWPLWAGSKPNKYGVEEWKTLLLNVENPVIFQLRKTLLESSIGTEKFIEQVMGLESKRNDLAHKSTEKAEREEAEEEMRKKLEESQVVTYDAVQAALRLLKGKDKVENKPVSQDDPLFTDVSKERLNYRLLRMPHLSFDTDIETIIKKIIFEDYTSSGGEKIPQPQGIWVSNEGGYLLFESFDDAYTVWSDEGVFDHFNGWQVKDMVIEDALYYNEYQSISVKIKLKSAGWTIEKYKTEVGCGNALMIIISKDEDLLFLIYQRIDRALIHYEKCKAKLGYSNVEFLPVKPKLMAESKTMSEKEFFNPH